MFQGPKLCGSMEPPSHPCRILVWLLVSPNLPLCEVLVLQMVLLWNSSRFHSNEIGWMQWDVGR